LLAGPIGSEDRTITVYRTYTQTGWSHQVVAGCWSGTLNELTERIHDPSTAWGEVEDEFDAKRWQDDYLAFITFAQVRVSEWMSEPWARREDES
jgi:hypothetical protein